MSINLYTAPNCARCSILKRFLTSRGQTFSAHDYLADKDAFNAFYRVHRSELHRSAERGLEFPIYENGDVVKQGIGEILAYLIAGDALKDCIVTTGRLHGWISGIRVSACPEGQEENFLAIMRLLDKGDLQIIMDSDGRRADLLEKVLAEKLVTTLQLNILGPAELYPVIAGGPLAPEDLKKSIALARGLKDSVIRVYVAAYKDASGAARRITPAEAGAAAEMIFNACGDHMLPCLVEAGPSDGLPELPAGGLLPYRSKMRNFLMKTEISKA